jgi:hypothetical protein
MNYEKMMNVMPYHTWYYFEPKWWQWKWRGGKFAYINKTLDGTKNKNGEHYLECLKDLFEFDDSGSVKWSLTHIMDCGRHYEIATVWFKNKDDAMMFKLSWA